MKIGYAIRSSVLLLAGMAFFSLCPTSVQAAVIHLEAPAVDIDCAQIGTWDEASRTCTMGADLSASIVISASDMTLDGNGHSVDATGTGTTGLFIASSDFVTVKNISVRNGSKGIWVANSSATTLDHVAASHSDTEGIRVDNSPGTRILDSESSDNATGIYISDGSVRLFLRRSNFHDNRILNFNIYSSIYDSGEAGLDIDTSNTLDGHPLYYFEHIHGQAFDSLPDPGAFYCIRCSDVTISSSTFASPHNNSQIVLWGSEGTSLLRNIVRGASYDGLDATYSTSTRLVGNTFDADSLGVSLYRSPSSVFEGNVFSNNPYGAIFLSVLSGGAEIHHNMFDTNDFTISITASPDVSISQNDFLDVRSGGDVYAAVPDGLKLSEVLPTGGNYWQWYSRDSSPCADIDADGVCDNPYVQPHSSVQDAFPWKLPSGWLTYASTTGNSSVLFLPGVEASRLYRGKRPDEGSGEKRLWEPGGNQDVRDLSLDDHGKQPVSLLPEYSVYTKDVVDEAYISEAGPNIYKSFLASLDGLKSAGSIADYSAVPYDWRLSLQDILSNGTKSGEKISYASPSLQPYILSELTRLASSSQNSKVTIIAHSNGGLLAKALMQKLADTHDPLLAKIDKIILVAVPQVGTPAAIAALLHGYGQGIPASFAPLLLSESVAREFGHNLPSAYNLLPSENYFTYVDTPVATFDASLPEWSTAYGDVIHSRERLHTFLTGTYDRVDAGSGNTTKPDSLSDELETQAEQAHAVLDNWVPPAGVKVYEIAGWGVPDTMSGIEYKEGRCYSFSCGFLSKTIKPYPTWTVDGDGTVVTPSALWMGGGGVERYWVDLKGYNRDHQTETFGGFLSFNHKNVLEVNNLQDFLKDVLRNSLKSIDQYTYISTSSPASTDHRLIYALHSSIPLNIYDEDGNHTGISTTTGKVEENVKGTYHTRIGDTTYIFAPVASTTRIIIDPGNSNDTGTSTLFTLETDEYAGKTRVASTTFKDVPIRKHGKAVVTLHGKVNTISPLEVDTDGDQVPDIIVQPKLDDVAVAPIPDGFFDDATSSPPVATSTDPVSDPGSSSSSGSGSGSGTGTGQEQGTTTSQTVSRSTPSIIPDPIASGSAAIAVANGPVVFSARANSSQPGARPQAVVIAATQVSEDIPHAVLIPVRVPQEAGVSLPNPAVPEENDTAQASSSAKSPLLAQAVSAPGVLFLLVHTKQVVAVVSGIGILLLIIFLV
jgi:nitrous oxidase accessory protein NosD